MKYDLRNLNFVFSKLPWHELWGVFHPIRSIRGQKPDFTWIMLIKATILQWQLHIVNDTDFASYLKSSDEAVELCGMPRAPSHDVLSKFTRKHSKNFDKIHRWLDEILDKEGVFNDDDLAGDGTNVPLHKPQNKPDINCFGAKSNFEKFYGLWLMLITSVNTSLVRAFNYDKARVGQIPLMFKLLTSGIIKPNSKIFLDGIFDVKDIHAAVAFDQESLPMIHYNAKNSRYKSRKDLPIDDWRKDFNPLFKDGLWMIIESSKRTAVERTNSDIKMNHILKEVYERSRRLSTKSQSHIHKLICGSIIMPQINKLVEIYTPKLITLIDYMPISIET